MTPTIPPPSTTSSCIWATIRSSRPRSPVSRSGRSRCRGTTLNLSSKPFVRESDAHAANWPKTAAAAGGGERVHARPHFAPSGPARVQRTGAGLPRHAPAGVGRGLRGGAPVAGRGDAVAVAAAHGLSAVRVPPGVLARHMADVPGGAIALRAARRSRRGATGRGRLPGGDRHGRRGGLPGPLRPAGRAPGGHERPGGLPGPDPAAPVRAAGTRCPAPGAAGATGPHAGPGAAAEPGPLADPGARRPDRDPAERLPGAAAAGIARPAVRADRLPGSPVRLPEPGVRAPLVTI